MKTLKLKSPGKVNLRLDVLGRRPDGYHDLRMLNSAISIYDDVEMEVIDRGIEVFCEDDPNVPSGDANIVFQASKEIMAYSNKNVGIRIKIKKRIPSAAGMGGGSSNAATVLAVNTTYGSTWLRPTTVLAPRLFKFGVEVNF